MRRSDGLLLLAILCVAAALRLWAPWDDVFAGNRVNFLETDSWYHVRLVENQVRNFPHRVTADPYAGPDGQYVAVAPLLDTLIATVVVATQGTDASAAYIERVAAIVPAIAGVLAVVAVWALATGAFDRRAGLIAALLAAILPGHFLDRTLVGFVDHHALEVLFAFATMAALARGLSRQDGAAGSVGPPVLAGVFLGLYLLSWASGAYFVAILAVWIVLAGVISRAAAARAAARSAIVAAVVALAMVLLFQDPALFRYGTQLASLAALLIAALVVHVFSNRLTVIVAATLSLFLLCYLLFSLLFPALVQQVMNDLARFQPDPTRMAVLEARPLFMYTGNWSWQQPWTFFRSGFYVGLIATAGLVWSIGRSRRVDHLLIVCFTLANYLATLGQNRFGYYLVPATAVVCGWIAVRILDWGGVPHAGAPLDSTRTLVPFQRELAVIVVAGVIVAPNIVPAAITTRRAGGMPDYWFAAMAWVREHTPEPFASPRYYYARYGRDAERASYSVMNWWDQGYWIIQTGRRVPVANPTQGGAPEAARFLTATDEAEAMSILSAHRARFAIVDWELPFRDGGGGALAGRFQNLADWAGAPTSRFYSLCFGRTQDTESWTPVWLFREAYYQSMAYRLMVLGGAAANPQNNTFVVQMRDRIDGNGRRFCEVTSREQHGTAGEARRAAAERGAGYEAVGLSPWQPAFPTDAITGLKVAAEFRAPTQQANETPMVRIFETRQP